MNTIEQRADQLIRNEVYVCLSYLVATLAKGYGAVRPLPDWEHQGSFDLQELTEQASELCSPVPDWEEAARQAGWKIDADMFVHVDRCLTADASPLDVDGWEEVCAEYDIDPYEREIFEHWSISQRLADDLIELGERVDTDFAGLCVWGRTTSGQGIAQDHVIRQVLELIERRASAVVASFTSEDA